MKRVVAFKAEHSDQLWETARAAREAEFDYLMVNISNQVGTSPALREVLIGLARDLRGSVYLRAADAFLAAADYLREHRAVLTGQQLDGAEGER